MNSTPLFAHKPAADTGDEGFSLRKFLITLRRRQRTFITTLVLVSATSTAWLTYQRIAFPKYQGAFGLLVANPMSPTSSSTTASSGDPFVNAQIGAVALNQTSQDLPTLMRVLESPTVLEPVFTKLRSQFPGESLPDFRVEQYTANRDGRLSGAGILNVRVTGDNPAVLSATLDLTRDTFLEWSLTQRRERLQKAIGFLDQQAPSLEAKASQIQGKVEDFRLQNRLILPESEAVSTRTQVELFRNKLIQQQSETTRLEQLRSEVVAGRLVTSGFSSQASDTGSQTSVALTVPDQAQLAELAKLDAQLADARSRYVSDNPLLKQLERARGSLIPQIQATQLEAIDTTLKQFSNQVQSLQRQINALESRFNVQPAQLREFAQLEQQLRQAEGNLLSYQRSREQFQLEMAQNTEPWTVIVPPLVNPNPVEPKVGPGLLRSLLLGLVAASGAALLREKMDNVFQSSNDVEEELGESMLGHVPYIELFEGVRAENSFLLQILDGSDASNFLFQKFQYQEAFRNIAASLRFLNSDKPIRSIALSSSIPSEGKSLMVVMLAKTLNELGQRVLLVDSDLRKPQIHYRLGVDNINGLSNLLTDEAPDWRSLITPVSNHIGWDLLTAGPQPPDPPRLLSSQRMANLVQDITTSGDYDTVIVDTPPALGLADASLVAENMDGLLMVVSLGQVPRDLPKQAIRRIREAGAPVLGVITNSRQVRRGRDVTTAYSYSAYGYGYGYGYGSSGYNNGTDSHDPLLAYSSRKENGPKGWKTAIPTPANIRRNMRRTVRGINKWLDE